MKEINNLVYELEINYINNSGIDSSIYVKFNDNGLKIKSIKIRNVCITEETIKGRVLSGKFDNSDYYCGYKYDYQNGENLLNLNPNVSIHTATSLINKTKMDSDFISAELVLSSILRNDYRVVTLNKGNLNIIKTVSAQNERLEHCTLQETINLSKSKCDECFVEQYKKRVYKIEDKCVVEENQTLEECNIKLQLNELSNIISKHPQNYKELIELKNQILKNIDNTNNEEKTL